MQHGVWNKRQVPAARIQAKHKDPSRLGRPPATASIPIDDVRELLMLKESVVSLLHLKDVARRTSLSKGQIYRMIAAGDFPKPISLSQARRAWVESEINDWIKVKVTERDADCANQTASRHQI
jgi:prophage regulatory protein